jgi:hypothetical protein
MTGAGSSRAVDTDARGGSQRRREIAMSSKQANSEIAESTSNTKQVASLDAEPLVLPESEGDQVACREAAEAAHGRQRGRTRGRTAGPKQALGR